jgi:Stretch-activated Ca2+-permeable channel component
MRMLYLKSPSRLAPTAQFILLFLLLATSFLPPCLASESFADVILYDDVLGMDIGSAFEALPLLRRESHLVARQSNESRQLSDNSIVPIEILPGTTEYWTFSPSFLNFTKNYTGSTLYITVGACTQPFPKVGLNATEIYAKESPPTLQLYYSTDSANTRPGPHSDATRQNMTELSQGFTSVNITLADLKKDVNIAVYAQNITSDWQGSWTYQIGSSTKGMQIKNLINCRTATASGSGSKSLGYRYLAVGRPYYNG